RRYPLSLGDPNDPAYNDMDPTISGDPTLETWFKWDAHLVQCVDGWNTWPGYYPTSANSAAGAVRLAVIDTGIDYNHPDFVLPGGTGSSVANGGKLDRSLDVSILNGVVTPNDAWDVYGHGTHVTGIAAASTNNGAGTTGNALNAKVLSIRIADASGHSNESD